MRLRRRCRSSQRRRHEAAQRSGLALQQRGAGDGPGGGGLGPDRGDGSGGDRDPSVSDRVGFTLNLRLRNLHRRERRGFWPFPEFGYHGGRTVPADAFRFTIEFADGRSVTNLDPAPSDPEVPAFEQPMLSSGPGTGLVGSGSSPDRWGWDMDYRARPLPPPGPLAFVCV
jgi:hypothetical protein